MLNMIHIRFLEYKRMWSVVLSMTAMAIVFIYTFGVGFSQEYKPVVIVVDEDHSTESEAIISGLLNINDFKIQELNYEDALIELKKSNAIAIIAIPKGYQESIYKNEGQIDFIKTGSVMEHSTLKMELQNIVGRSVGNTKFVNQIELVYRMLDINIDKDGMYEIIEDIYRDRPMLSADIKTFETNSVNFYDSLKQSFMGFILFFSLFTMVFGIGSIIEDKQTKVWHRQKVSPISSMSILGSALVVGFVVGAFQIGTMFISGKYLFNIELGQSMPALLLVLSAYIIAAMCLGLFVSGLVRTEQQLSAISPVIIVSTSMLGGCMWPLEMVSNNFIRGLSIITPQRWAMEGLQKVILYEGNVVDVIQPVSYLLVLALIFFALAIIPYKKIL